MTLQFQTGCIFTSFTPRSEKVLKLYSHLEEKLKEQPSASYFQAISQLASGLKEEDNAKALEAIQKEIQSGKVLKALSQASKLAPRMLSLLREVSEVIQPALRSSSDLLYRPQAFELAYEVKLAQAIFEGVAAVNLSGVELYDARLNELKKTQRLTDPDCRVVQILASGPCASRLLNQALQLLAEPQFKDLFHFDHEKLAPLSLSLQDLRHLGAALLKLQEKESTVEDEKLFPAFSSDPEMSQEILRGLSGRETRIFPPPEGDAGRMIEIPIDLLAWIDHPPSSLRAFLPREVHFEDKTGRKQVEELFKALSNAEDPTWGGIFPSGEFFKNAGKTDEAAAFTVWIGALTGWAFSP